jgi:hypothetical protein
VITTYKGIDYGPRKGTLGFVVHMTEGNGGIGDVLYLAQRAGETTAQWKARVRGVSANFVIINDGTVYQMVGWGRASGSMNPANRGPASGFYNTDICKSVLGTHFTDPNAYSISVEVAGKRANGPTKAQTDALIALVAEARQRYPSLRGAYGHADQTSTKGCPGLAAEMRRFWSTVGHGLFLPDTSEEPMKLYNAGGRLITLPVGEPVYDQPAGAKVGAIGDGPADGNGATVFRVLFFDAWPTPKWAVIDGGGEGKLSRWIAWPQ